MTGDKKRLADGGSDDEQQRLSPGPLVESGQVQFDELDEEADGDGAEGSDDARS